MEDSIAHGALRRLSVDIANLSSQLAVMQSGMEYVREVANNVTPDKWTREMVDGEDGHPEMVITLRGEQVDALMRFLAAVGALG